MKIKNRLGLNIDLVVENESGNSGLAFVIHGLGGSKNQDHTKVMRQAFLDNDYVVVSFDATNSVGESDGDMIDVSVTSYENDLEDVITWASAQIWYFEPFVVIGHSLGGIAQIVYAGKFPDKIKALAPLGSVVSGQIWSDSKSSEELAEWQERGYYEKVSRRTGAVHRVGWQLHEDALQYDGLQIAAGFTFPVLLIAGSEEDPATAIDKQQLLLNAIGSDKKELHIIDGMPHTPQEQSHLDEYYRLIDAWIKSL